MASSPRDVAFLRPPAFDGALPELPRTLTSFVGRERELEAIRALLASEDVRLLTLAGPGGAGKTRLAIRAGKATADADGTDVWFVPLVAVRDPEQAPAAIERAIGLREVSGRSPLDVVTSFLRERRAVLILDNFEPVIEAGPAVVDLLLACPELTILVTSRIVLGVSGEHVYRVPPLALPVVSPHPGVEALRAVEAVRLFVERARASDPGFDLTAANAATVAEICRRLDGLPLAIELAAARMGSLSPAALLSLLRHRLTLLTRGPRDAPARHQSMREAIAWSHDLLPDTERALFRRLGVFVGGFTLEATQAVGGESALDGVSSLAASSLLGRTEGVDGEPRFAMLETIREYALEQMEASGEEPAIRKAHLGHFADLAERMWLAPSGREHTRILMGLLAEMGNVRAALDWALEHEPHEALRLSGSLNAVWIFSSHLAEGRAWVELALVNAADAALPLRTRAMVTAGWLAHDQGDLASAEAYLTEAREHARALADVGMLGASVALLMNVSLALGDAPRAWSLALEAREIADAIGTPLELAISRLNLGQAAAALGDLGQARALFEEALAAHRVSGGVLGPAITQRFLGDVALAQGDDTGAAKAFREAAVAFGELSDIGNVSNSLEGLACAVASRRPELAARLLGAADALREGTRQPRVEQDVARYERAIKRLGGEAASITHDTPWAAGHALSLEDVLVEVGAMDALIAAPPAVSRYGLTSRELEVLRLLIEGLSDQEIAHALYISRRTVTTHVGHIYDKLGVSSRAAAAAMAVRGGIA